MDIHTSFTFTIFKTLQIGKKNVNLIKYVFRVCKKLTFCRCTVHVGSIFATGKSMLKKLFKRAFMKMIYPEIQISFCTRFSLLPVVHILMTSLTKQL